jgi:hypothetical protein
MDRYLSQTLFEANFAGKASLTATAYEMRSAKEAGFKEEWLSSPW